MQMNGRNCKHSEILVGIDNIGNKYPISSEAYACTAIGELHLFSRLHI